jgi:diguanylate cyclase (GGDEF)-like protein/PAS domain S-box-containing protein
VPIYGADGRLRGYRGIDRDVTVRKKAEEVLQVSEARYRRLFETAQDGILILDANTGEIDDVNQYLVQMLGFSKEELLGKKLQEIDFFKNLKAGETALIELQEKEYIRHEDLPLVTKDGQQLDVEFISVVYPVDSQKVIQCNIRDISKHKQAQEALQQINENLQARVKDIESLQEQLREQAIRDPLTGVFNRRYLQETLDREIARASRNNQPVGVMIMDVDHFKKVNDSYGHRGGDQMLRALGNLLKTNIRAEDIPCRYGGEEFVIVMPGAPLNIARDRAKLIRAKFDALRVLYGNLEMHTTVSLGVAAYPLHGSNAEEVLIRADRALYQAKQNGRNRVVTYQSTSEMPPPP